MRSALGRQLRRLAGGIAAISIATVATISVTAAPAHADTYSDWYYLKNQTTWCLATDWTTNVYSFGRCDGEQRWQFQFLDAYPGFVVIHNEVTGLCLMQLDYTRVGSAPCDGSRVEMRWFTYRDATIQSANTWYYLTDSPTNSDVYLSAEVGPRQRWQWV